jgi:hypothetical protein
MLSVWSKSKFEFLTKYLWKNIYLYWEFVMVHCLPLPQIYGAVWRSDITEVRRRSSGIQDVQGRTPRRAGTRSGDQHKGTWAGGCRRRPGVSGGACSRRCRKGIGGCRWRKGTMGWQRPVAGGGTMGTRAGGGATHTYRDSKKLSLHIFGY